ncbi:hypothetical protein AB0J66_49245, partial [Actinoplanes sp. NPDC049598]|uniref:hypothetical protein n=1 Tax=Actinoplanes sp. NPDC049598 TaxID=3154626 RepID=UPI0034440C9E
MTDTDIRQALTRATDHLESPPDLLDRVRAGGRRRVVRRRTLIGGGLAVGAAGVAGDHGRQHVGGRRLGVELVRVGEQESLDRHIG